MKQDFFYDGYGNKVYMAVDEEIQAALAEACVSGLFNGPAGPKGDPGTTDYNDLTNKPNCADALHHAAGEVISLDNSAHTPLYGLKLYGKTTQDGTPSPEAPVELVSVGDGGTIPVQVGISLEDTAPQTIIANTPNGLPGIPVASGEISEAEYTGLIGES